MTVPDSISCHGHSPGIVNVSVFIVALLSSFYACSELTNENLSACLVLFSVWASKVFNYCENGAKDAWTSVWKSVRPGGWCGMARWGASGVISPNFVPPPSSPLLCSSSPRQSLPAPSRMNGGSPGFSGQSFSFKMVGKYTCVHLRQSEAPLFDISLVEYLLVCKMTQYSNDL